MNKEKEISIIQYLPLTHTRATLRLVSKLHNQGIHAILDLEDSVQDPFSIQNTIEIKSNAREDFYNYISNNRFKDSGFSAQPFIRINDNRSEFFNDDVNLINALLSENFEIRGIFLPKTEDCESINLLASKINKDIEIVPMVETEKGYLNARNFISHPSVSYFHYGHFDYALDSKQWPFYDPNHEEYWDVVDKLVNLSIEKERGYIHTPFPFPQNSSLFWEMIRFMQTRYQNAEILYCTINAELSFSNLLSQNSILEFVPYPTDQSLLKAIANEIVEDYELGRANKRSFGVSNNRFIPPHQYFAAKRYLSILQT